MTEDNLPRISLDQPYGIFSAALVILSHFSDSLVIKIDNDLSKLYGDNWKRKLQEDGLLPFEFNIRDPQAVLKELARNGSSQLRIPLNSEIPREKLLYFYNGLDDLLGERNAWVHRQLAENMPELRDLATITSKLLAQCSLDFDYIVWLEKLSTTNTQSSSSTSSNSVEMVPLSTEIEILEEGQIMKSNEEEEPQIGSPISSRFLAHSYVVEANGDVSDRNTGVKVSEFNSSYQLLLQLALTNLKVGSRLRITQEGQLCSFFEDHWGFLIKIDPKEWFPNHLK
jgi:hypothetical protein